MCTDGAAFIYVQDLGIEYYINSEQASRQTMTKGHC